MCSIEPLIDQPLDPGREDVAELSEAPTRNLVKDTPTASVTHGWRTSLEVRNVSTLSISPAFAGRPLGRPSARPSGRPSAGRRRPDASAGSSVRLTRRGRLTLVAFFVSVIALLMLFLGSLAAASQQEGSAPAVRMIQVQPGDTLYDIARAEAPSADVQQTIYDIEQLNSLPSADISVGQRLAIPMPEGGSGR